MRSWPAGRRQGVSPPDLLQHPAEAESEDQAPPWQYPGDDEFRAASRDLGHPRRSRGRREIQPEQADPLADGWALDRQGPGGSLRPRVLRPGGGVNRFGIAYNAGMAGATSLRDLAAGVGGETRAQRLYDEDFWTWTQEQAGALRRRDVDAIDWENVIEEIETLGRSEERAWTSRCTNVVSHLLKIEHSRVEQHLNHWRKEVEAWRNQMYDSLEEGPGLKGKLSALLAKAWRGGRKAAVAELVNHGAPDTWADEKALGRRWGARLPVDCPYVLEDIAGYDPNVKDAEPRADVWPAPVAQRLNEALGADYPVRHRGVERGSGRSR